MRDFSNIPPWSPCPQDHVEWEPRIDQMIGRASRLLDHVSEIEALDKLVDEGASLGEATNAIRAGAILNEDRSPRVPSIVDALDIPITRR